MPKNAKRDKLREQVMQYVNANNHGALIFREPGFYSSKTLATRSGKIQIREDNIHYDKNGKLKLSSLIEEILKLARNHYSYNKKGEPETSPGRSRSTLDIWRHAKDYIKNITIFEVMVEMTKMAKDGKLDGNWCDVVHRSVFQLVDDYEENSGSVDMYYPDPEFDGIDDDNWDSFDSDDEGVDEYGMTFEEWGLLA